ncbi:MAG: hypothetical protein HRT61_01355, partial [Ekhidna sp.]|nr:hypothetical protein [Ekhidna sp.]
MNNPLEKITREHNGKTYRFPAYATEEQIQNVLSRIDSGEQLKQTQTSDGRTVNYLDSVSEDQLREYENPVDYEDNTGILAMLGDIQDGISKQNEARRYYDMLQNTQDPELRRRLTYELVRSKAASDLYFNNPEQDNFLTGLGKQVTGEFAKMAPGIATGAALGTASGVPLIGTVGGAIAGGAYHSYNDMQVENAVREMFEDGDLTWEDQQDANRTAAQQAALFAIADGVSG